MQKKLSDKSAMRRALALALRGAGATRPNPMVGAVLVSGGELLGQGWHKRAGGAHAEIEALRQAGARASGATLYVSLEPCNHHGKTPPCTQAILQAGIARVVCAMRDPNPDVQGGGFEFLRQQGVLVEYGLLQEEAEVIMRPWLVWMREKRPFVLLKLAQDSAGAIAGPAGARVQISSSASLAHAQRLRRYFDAIMVGVDTVLNDDPMLTNRSGRGAQPLKVVLDSSLKTPSTAKIFDSKNRVLIFASEDASDLDEKRLEALGAEVIRLPLSYSSFGLDLGAAFRQLYIRGAQAVLIEGGARLTRSVLEQKLCDRFLLYRSSLKIENGMLLNLESELLSFSKLWEKRKGGDKLELYCCDEQ